LAYQGTLGLFQYLTAGLGKSALSITRPLINQSRQLSANQPIIEKVRQPADYLLDGTNPTQDRCPLQDERVELPVHCRQHAVDVSSAGFLR